MLGPEGQRQLAEAAVETLDKIRSDRKKVTWRLERLLIHLESHIYDPNLDVNRLLQACGIRDKSVTLRFHNALGMPPYAYIQECRLETACRLLRDTDLKIWQIADLVGYSGIEVFSRAFHRWCGLRPTVYRREKRRVLLAAQHRNGQNGDTASGHLRRTNGLGFRSREEPVAPEILRKALDGSLETEQAKVLIQHLLDLYPSSLPA